MKGTTRRAALRAGLVTAAGFTASAALAAAQAPLARAADWPTRPVRLVIPFPPGGTLDTVGRLVAQKLADQTGPSMP